MVFFLSARVNKMLDNVPPSCRFVFCDCGSHLVRHSAGLHQSSIASTFIITAACLVLRQFSARNERSLAGLGSSLHGLIGLIWRLIVGILCKATAAVCHFGIGVLIFTGLTAWDAQRLKQMACLAAGWPHRYLRSGGRAVAIGLINLFFFLLRLAVPPH